MCLVHHSWTYRVPLVDHRHLKTFPTLQLLFTPAYTSLATSKGTSMAAIDVPVGFTPSLEMNFYILI